MDGSPNQGKPHVGILFHYDLGSQKYEEGDYFITRTFVAGRAAGAWETRTSVPQVGRLWVKTDKTVQMKAEVEWRSKDGVLKATSGPLDFTLAAG